MTTTQESPRITNSGTRPATPRKLFVNIPVSDLQRSIDFFEALGFTFNTQFTDSTATSMLVGEDAYFMLMSGAKFDDFSNLPRGNPKTETSALFALGVNSREDVNAMVNKAVSIGGAHAKEAQDHGFMYGWSFYDPDGYHWEVFWMDPGFVND